jgi:hypothetical protein
MHVLESLLAWLSPFRRMKDVGCGTREERTAAYRYNRRKRSELMACMRRWAVALAAAALLTDWFDAIGGAGSHEGSAANVWVYLAAACATLFVFGVCVLLLTAYVYIHLISNEG